MIEVINFLKFYYRLLRQNLLDQIFKKKSELPSALLRKRVHGSFCPESYLQVGENIFQDLLNLSKLNTKFDHRILDFGCGPGRIARNFFQQGVFVYGTDIDEEAINYCKKNFANGDWCVNDWTPPFKYKSNFFDFIYSVSVFTHINQELQRKWLKEVSRILKPDGIAVVSIHGKNCFGKLNREEISLINDTGFYFKTTIGKPMDAKKRRCCQPRQKEGNVRKSVWLLHNPTFNFSYNKFISRFANFIQAWEEIVSP